jgi:hypothetical protein
VSLENLTKENRQALLLRLSGGGEGGDH